MRKYGKVFKCWQRKGGIVKEMKKMDKYAGRLGIQ